MIIGNFSLVLNKDESINHLLPSHSWHWGAHSPGKEFDRLAFANMNGTEPLNEFGSDELFLFDNVDVDFKGSLTSLVAGNAAQDTCVLAVYGSDEKRMLSSL